MQVPFIDLAAQFAQDATLIRTAIERVGRSGQFILGPEVEQFENALQNYLGSAHASRGGVVAVASGSDALYLALLAGGIGRGDAVALPGFTFVSALEAVVRVGATPVLVDAAATTFNVAPDAYIELVAGQSVRAVIATHLFGEPADLAPLRHACTEHGVVLIEDAAQAMGAWLSETPAGGWGDYGCFSFYPTKNLCGLGDGGAILARDPAKATWLRQMRNHGRDGNAHVRFGINSRLDALHAAVLRARLPLLDAAIARRRAIAAHYRHDLRDLPIVLPTDDSGAHTFNQFVIVNDTRDALALHLRKCGIETKIYYPQGCHAHPALPAGTIASLPNVEHYARTALALPLHPALSDAQAMATSDAVRTFFAAG